MTDLIESRARELRALCERHWVRRLSLFGSALREDFDPESSDLDFVVEFQPMTSQEHAEAYFEFIEALEELFGRRVDLVEAGVVRNPYLRREIEAGQETLYGAA